MGVMRVRCVCMCDVRTACAQVRAKREVWVMQQEAAALDASQNIDPVATDRAVQLRLGRHRRVKSLFWMGFEACHCALMLTAMVMLFVYVFQLNQSARLRDR